MRPTNPSNRDIADEFGIPPESPGWKKKCSAMRPQSKLQAEYEQALARYEQTDEAREDRREANRIRLEKAARYNRLNAIGCGYLIGAQMTKSKRGTWASVHGSKASPIPKKACDVLGIKPGPGNY